MCGLSCGRRRRKNKVGPELNAIIGRKVAAVEGFNYSAAFKTKAEEGWVWDESHLTEYLTNPKAYIKGTKMAFAGLKSPRKLQISSPILKHSRHHESSRCPPSDEAGTVVARGKHMNIKIGLESEVSGCFDNAGKMKFEDAVEAAIRCAIPVSQTERVALLRAAGRILAGDVGAPVPLPRFDHSAMDGFAVRTRSFDGPGPWNARIESVIAAGSSGSRSVPEDHAAVEIYTGAPIPYGFDAVMTRESCVRADGKIAFHVAPTPGLNIRKAGEDIVDGEVAVTDGSVVTPHIAALLAGLGIREIEVRPKVRVAFFSTGSELRQPGERLQDGQLYDSNRYMVTAMLALPWIDFTDLCHLDDNLDMIAQCLADASNQFDVVIASGGMSHGGLTSCDRL